MDYLSIFSIENNIYEEAIKEYAAKNLGKKALERCA